MIVALEGIDNCGKTTVSDLLVHYFERQGKSVVVSKELSTDVGAIIKKATPTSPLSPIIKTFLFAADRQLRLEKIGADGYPDVLIFDRYLHPAISYRKAEGIDENWVHEVNRFVPPFDVGFYIDITPEESVRRNTDTKFNIHYTLEHLSMVRESYLSYVAAGELILIDGMRSIDDVFADITSILPGEKC